MTVHFTPGRKRPIVAICIHTAECRELPNAAKNIKSWFDSGTPQASAHYAVDDGFCVSIVAESDTAWHAGPVNDWSIGIELAGVAAQTDAQWRDPYSLSVLRNAAALCASICVKYTIPIRRLIGDDVKAGKAGLFGHVDVTRAYASKGGHTDPGEAFPWDNFLDAIRKEIECLSSLATA